MEEVDILHGIETKDIAFIIAGEGLIYQGCKLTGFDIFHPYKDRNLFMRVLREVWQILSVPRVDIFYEKNVLRHQFEHIIIFDVLITRRYLTWIKNKFPQSKIHFIYNNMVGFARHLKPDQLPPWIEVWTFDDYDSRVYGIRKYHSYYFPSLCMEPQEKQIDVFFVGKDKGRAEYLLNLEQRLKDMGLKTKFIITPDGRFTKHKPFYSDYVPYWVICEYLSKTKAVLNVSMDNQEGMTVRDLEAIFNHIKLITTNKSIRSHPVFSNDIVFILDKDKMESLPEFLNSTYPPIDDDIMARFTFGHFIRQVTGVYV
ncbi:MAG: hypothetical protein JW811_07570 [Clostridiales bacterium]|nr:hypothetical protein [Clostridiales bacterium]